MTKVCVIGGGTAGAEAAREVAMGAGEVTVIEKSARPDPPWRTWPDLMSKSEAPRPDPSDSPAGIVIQDEAKAVSSGRVLTAGGLRMEFDAVVMATGSTFRLPDFPGRRKPGVFVLDGASEYSGFPRASASSERIGVQGEGARALEVADRLGADRGVTVVVTHWSNGEPSPKVREVIEKAAAERGISVTTGTVARALGSGMLEAVQVKGAILPCGALAVLPPRVPRVVLTDALRGQLGGLLVDCSLMTSASGVYAAGGCAELRAGSHQSMTLDGEPAMSGRVAAANSTGRRLQYHTSAASAVVFLGVRWTRLGFGFEVSEPRAPSLALISAALGPSSACALAYDRVSGRVVGIDAVEPSDPCPAPTPCSLEGANLRSLAYGGSSDISLISDTARLGLRNWQSYSSATT